MKEIKHPDHLDNMARQGTTKRHTPGPWHVEGAVSDKKGYIAIVGPGDPPSHICDVFPFGKRAEGQLLAQHRANANLIAHAPDMLAELEWLYEKYHHDSTRDVLTKAKGII